MYVISINLKHWRVVHNIYNIHVNFVLCKCKCKLFYIISFLNAWYFSFNVWLETWILNNCVIVMKTSFRCHCLVWPLYWKTQGFARIQNTFSPFFHVQTHLWRYIYMYVCVVIYFYEACGDGLWWGDAGSSWAGSPVARLGVPVAVQPTSIMLPLKSPQNCSRPKNIGVALGPCCFFRSL